MSIGGFGYFRVQIFWRSVPTIGRGPTQPVAARPPRVVGSWNTSYEKCTGHPNERVLKEERTHDSLAPFLASTCRRESAAKANGGTATSCLGEAHTWEHPWPRVFTLVRRSKIWRDIEMRQQGAGIGSARRPSSAAQTTSSGSYIHKRTGCWICPCKRKGLAPDAPSRIDHAEFRQRLPPDHLCKRGVSSCPSTAPRW